MRSRYQRNRLTVTIKAYPSQLGATNNALSSCYIQRCSVTITFDGDIH